MKRPALFVGSSAVLAILAHGGMVLAQSLSPHTEFMLCEARQGSGDDHPTESPREGSVV